jgi:hypothetical protein
VGIDLSDNRNNTICPSTPGQETVVHDNPTPLTMSVVAGSAAEVSGATGASPSR